MKYRLIQLIASTFAYGPSSKVARFAKSSSTALQETFDRRTFCQGAIATTAAALLPGLPVFGEEEEEAIDQSPMSATEEASMAKTMQDSPPEDRFVTLEWDDSNMGLCFCEPTIRLDIRKVQPTPLTIGAIFGLSNDVEHIYLYETMNDEIKHVRVDDNCCWPLQGGHTYSVVYHGEDRPPCCIGEMYSHLNLNQDKVYNMSLEFYRGIWAAAEDESDFRSHFVRSVASPSDAADNQARWLMETWGGPKLYTEKHGQNVLQKRMRSKHSSSRRMTYPHACLWLDHMRGVVNSMFQDEEARRVLGMYWMHVYGFFPFSDEERVGIQKRAFDSDNALLNVKTEET